jgi:hypothetical protein
LPSRHIAANEIPTIDYHHRRRRFAPVIEKLFVDVLVLARGWVRYRC